MTAEEYVALIEARGGRVRRERGGWMVECPAHLDRTPSLHVTEADDRVLLYCHAGCSTEDVVGADGLELADLFHERRNGHREVAYDYTDGQGALLYQVVRFEPKDFRQRRPDGRGGWIWNLRDTPRVLYRLPAVLAAIEAGREVWLPEGEKDVHALERAGVTATTNPGGAEGWRRGYAEALRGARVVVVADRDEAGRKRAARAVADLEGEAASVRVVEAADGKDAADHLRAGRTLEEFVAVEPRRATFAEAWAAAAGGGDEPPPGDGSSPAAGDDLLVDMADAMRHASDPIPYLAEPIAVQGLVSILVGRHSSMKSWLLMLIGAAIQAGEPLMAGFRIANATVLYVDAEMGARLMARRFQAAGLPADAFHVADGFRLRLPQSKTKIAGLIKRTGAKLVVLDSLRRLAPGARENDSDDMSPIMACLAELSRELDVAIVLIHHRSTKEGAAETRGSSAIEDQADIVLAFEAVRDDPDEQRRRLRTVKFRPDEEPLPSWVRVRSGFRFSIVQAEPFEGADQPARPRDEHRVSVLDALSDAPRSGRSIAAGLELSEATARRLLHDLEADGEAEQTDAGWVRQSPDPPGGRGGDAPSEGVRHQPAPHTVTHPDAPPDFGSTMRDLGALPPPTHNPPADAPAGGSGRRAQRPHEGAPEWYLRAKGGP